MRKTILMFLRQAAKLQPTEQRYSLDTYLVRIYKDTPPAEIRQVLRKMEEDGVVYLTGSWNILSAKIGGIVQGLQEVTIHASITAKGLEELGELDVPTGLFIDLDTLEEPVESTEPVTTIEEPVEEVKPVEPVATTEEVAPNTSVVDTRLESEME